MRDASTPAAAYSGAEAGPTVRPTPPPFSHPAARIRQLSGHAVHTFLRTEAENVNDQVVQGFGHEWAKFSRFSEDEIAQIGARYFDVLDPQLLDGARVLDAGCGTGRWSKYLAQHNCFIDAVDPSESVRSAAHLLSDLDNIRISQTTIDSLPFDDDTFDVIVCLGVLHHLPDPIEGLAHLLAKLKPGGVLLCYLYYSLDNRPLPYTVLFFLSNLLRRVVSRLPWSVRHFLCDLLAFTLYLPFVLLCRCLKAVGVPESVRRMIPLHFYEDVTLRVIRNDALDRFGTALEHRFSRAQIANMLQSLKMEPPTFSESSPFWHFVCRRPHTHTQPFTRLEPDATN